MLTSLECTASFSGLNTLIIILAHTLRDEDGEVSELGQVRWAPEWWLFSPKVSGAETYTLVVVVVVAKFSESFDKTMMVRKISKVAAVDKCQYMASLWLSLNY